MLAACKLTYRQNKKCIDLQVMVKGDRAATQMYEIRSRSSSFEICSFSVGRMCIQAMCMRVMSSKSAIGLFCTAGNWAKLE